MATVTTTEQKPQSNLLVNSFYSPSLTDEGNEQYKYAQYRVCAILETIYLLTPIQPTFPDVSWEPLKEVAVVDRGVGADPKKQSLLSTASKVVTITPAIGTELHGIDLCQLSDTQKDEL